MKFLTVVLYCRAGFEIQRAEAVEGARHAKEYARYLLSDQFARSAETTHETLRTQKVSIFAEGQPTGVDRLCEWDMEHPQHRRWRAMQPAE